MIFVFFLAPRVLPRVPQIRAKLCPFSLMESLMDYHYGRCESSLKNFCAALSTTNYVQTL